MAVISGHDSQNALSKPEKPRLVVSMKLHGYTIANTPTAKYVIILGISIACLQIQSTLHIIVVFFMKTFQRKRVLPSSTWQTERGLRLRDNVTNLSFL